MFSRFTDDLFDDLPPRQLQAGALYVGGLSKNQVARRLGMSRQGAQHLIRKFARRMADKGLTLYRPPSRAGRPPRRPPCRAAATPAA